jgi:type IV secretion system protein VirB6
VSQEHGVGFFASFFGWLTTQLAAYVGTKVATIAAALSPAVVTLATIYVMFWGYLSLTGRIQEPLLEAARRIFVMAAILTFTLTLAAQLPAVTDVFVNGPRALAAAIIGAPPVAIIDQIWIQGSTVGDNLLAAGSFFSADLIYYVAGVIVYLIIGLCAVYAAFLMALAQIATAVILALGPLFITMLFFDTTKRFFEAWIAQLANYALVGILTALVVSLLLQFVRAYSTSALASGPAVTVAEGFRLCVAAVLVLLIMRQVLPMAAGLASGIALASHNLISRTLASSVGGTRRTIYEMGRGLMDRDAMRYDSLRRKAGYHLGQGGRSLGRALWRGMSTRNSISRR